MNSRYPACFCKLVYYKLVYYQTISYYIKGSVRDVHITLNDFQLGQKTKKLQIFILKELKIVINVSSVGSPVCSVYGTHIENNNWSILKFNFTFAFCEWPWSTVRVCSLLIFNGVTVRTRKLWNCKTTSK